MRGERSGTSSVNTRQVRRGDDRGKDDADDDDDDIRVFVIVILVYRWWCFGDEND